MNERTKSMQFETTILTTLFKKSFIFWIRHLTFYVIKQRANNLKMQHRRLMEMGTANLTKCRLDYFLGRDSFGKLGVNGTLILKWILEK